jgi:hypothetical protein
MSTEKKVDTDTAWVFKQFLFEEVLCDLDNHFQRLNVDYMPIKGAYLICAGLARQIRSRTMVDIDILVRENDFKAVVSHFRSIPNISIAEGSWPVNKKGSRFEVTFYMPCNDHMVMVDIHNFINLRQRFILSPEMLFARGKKQGLRTLPCAEDALAICLCHGLSHAGHFFSDALFDDVVVLTDASINWGKFWDIAASTDVEAFMYYVLKKFERKGRVPPIPVPKKTLKFAYADVLLKFSGDRDLGILPRILRRIVIELPFCRDPAGLLLNKCIKRCIQ